MKHSTASCNSFIFFSFIFIYSHSFFALAIFIFHLMQAPHMIASTDTKILNAKAFICLGAQHLSGRPFLSGCIGSKLKSKFRCCWWFHDKMCHIWNLSGFEKFQLFTKCSNFYGKRMKIIQKKKYYAAQKPHWKCSAEHSFRAQRTIYIQFPRIANRMMCDQLLLDATQMMCLFCNYDRVLIIIKFLWVCDFERIVNMSSIKIALIYRWCMRFLQKIHKKKSRSIEAAFAIATGLHSNRHCALRLCHRFGDKCYCIFSSSWKENCGAVRDHFIYFSSFYFNSWFLSCHPQNGIHWDFGVRFNHYGYMALI